MRTAPIVASGMVFAVLAGCGSGTGTGTGTSSPPAASCDGGCPNLTPADETFLTNVCTALEACCVTNAVRATPDIAGCKAQIAQNGFSRDPAVQSGCLGELKDLASMGAACFPDLKDLSDPCVRLYYEPAGSRAPGEPCTQRADCAGAAGSITLCQGSCLRMARGKAGDGVCIGVVADDGVITAAAQSQPGTTQGIYQGVLCEHAAGLYCSFSNDKTVQTCQALGAGGAPCDYSMTCASGMCYGDDNPDGNLAGTCDAVVPAGQPCEGDTPAVCDAASYCVSDGSTPGPVCKPRLSAGSACNGYLMCASNDCGADGHCTTNSTWTTAGFCGFAR